MNLQGKNTQSHQIEWYIHVYIERDRERENSLFLFLSLLKPSQYHQKVDGLPYHTSVEPKQNWDKIIQGEKDRHFQEVPEMNILIAWVCACDNFLVSGNKCLSALLHCQQPHLPCNIQEMIEQSKHNQ